VPDPVLALAREADGPAWDDACLPAFAGRAASTLRVNRTALSRDEARSRLSEHGVTADPTRWATDGLDVREGTPLADAEWVPRRVLPQDEASQLVVECLAPRDGERVVDLCAGTGVKTSQLAAVAPGAETLAVDLDGRKLDRAARLCRAQGLTAPRTLACDARRLPADLAGRFDAVLLDAPCTGLGTLVRRPEVRYLRGPEDVARAAELQRQILRAALALVRPGGRLVYAVCSFALDEGPRVLDAVLADAPGFHRAPIALDAPFRTADGALAPRPWRDGMDGFWVARVAREGG
jgi:16S rRNA (cytosine967-C5)-methyltransferase